MWDAEGFTVKAPRTDEISRRLVYRVLSSTRQSNNKVSLNCMHLIVILEISNYRKFMRERACNAVKRNSDSSHVNGSSTCML